MIVIANSLFSQVVTRPGGEFTGLTNYLQVLTDPTFWPATLNTAIFAGASVVVHLVMGLGFAGPAQQPAARQNHHGRVPDDPDPPVAVHRRGDRRPSGA